MPIIKFIYRNSIIGKERYRFANVELPWDKWRRNVSEQVSPLGEVGSSNTAGVTAG